MAVFFNNLQGATKTSGAVKFATQYDLDPSSIYGIKSNPIISVSVTVAAPSYFLVLGNAVRRFAGRTDSYLNVYGPAGSNYAAGAQMSPRLGWTGQTALERTVYNGMVYGDTAGTYTFTITAASPTLWIYGRKLTKLSVLALEVG